MNFWEKLSQYITSDLPKYLGQTLEMVILTSLIALFFGLILGFILYYAKNSKNRSINILYKFLDVIVSIIRSFPFYVLMFFVIPFTRLVMNIFTGKAQAFSTEAFIVPLALAAIPFFAKLIENSLNETKKEVIEAGVALGLNTWEITTKIILKEALPAIISGITLAIITLIGYSAMAGAIGGGGLGFFAYDKGYVSYDFTMMSFAVITIIILVLLIQGCGNILYKLAKRGRLSYTKIGIGILSIILVFSSFKIATVLSESNLPKITIGTMSQPGEPILKNIESDLESLGYDLEIKLFNEFEALNNALKDGSIDANLFQHEPYLKTYNASNNTNLYNALTMYDCVYGAYSYKINSKEELKNTTKTIEIAVANDSSNLKRCLDLLDAEDIITKTYESSELSATDIDKYYKPNPSYNIKIVPMATSSIASAILDENCYLGIINATFAINAKLTDEELVFEEQDLEHQNANILAVRDEDKEEIWLETLVDLLMSEKSKEFINNEFKGTIKPYFISHI